MAEDIENAKVRPGHNGYDPEKLKTFLEAVEAEQAAIDTKMAEAKEACAANREHIKDIKEEACDKLGITKKVINTTLRQRRLCAQALACTATLDEGQRESFDQVQHALGGLANLPLGKQVLEEYQSRHPEKKAA